MSIIRLKPKCYKEFNPANINRLGVKCCLGETDYTSGYDHSIYDPKPFDVYAKCKNCKWYIKNKNPNGTKRMVTKSEIIPQNNMQRDYIRLMDGKDIKYYYDDSNFSLYSEYEGKLHWLGYCRLKGDN